jgi:hypothetical protein
VSKSAVYQLVYKGDLPSVEIPSAKTARGLATMRRIEQAEIDAFIARHRVTSVTTHGAFPL